MSTRCLRCGEAPTIDAHIIPKSAVRAIRSRGPDKKTMAVLGDRVIVARSQNGVYDARILCKDCDGCIGVADKWFAENLDDLHSAAFGRQPFEPVEVSLDARAALQFAVSVIYRASLSGLDHFADISLGPYLKMAGEIAVGSNRAEFDQPLVIINVLTSEHLDMRQFVFYPVKCSNGNGPYFIFTISGVQFLVKFGGRHAGVSDNDDLLSTHRIRPGATSIVCCYPFHESAEAQIMRNSKGRERAH